MTKKFLTCSIITILLFFSTSFCFAAEDNKTKDNKKSDLGSELTDSMNKIEKTADDLLTDNDNDEGTAAGAITDDHMNDEMINNNVMNDNKMNNNSGNYDATRTATDTDLMTGTTMDNTTWVWIILAVVGVIILATVWVYAMQDNGND